MSDALQGKGPQTQHRDRDRLLCFGVFELDPASGELRKAGRLVDLAPQPFQVLALLVESAGRPVSREAIRGHLWPQAVHVDFDQSINTCIRQIRIALNDSADGPRFVQTLPRRGYRFVAPVACVAAAQSAGVTDPFPVPSMAREGGTRPRGRASATLLALALAVLVTLVGVAYLRADREGAAIAREAASHPRILLAVLPFQTPGSDLDQRYFGDGLTEELIGQLGRLQPERLGVIARTSVAQLADSEREIGDLGRRLGVDYVLEGTVRRDGDRVRITAQLVQVKDRTYLWSESYGRYLEDIFAIQEDVARRVTKSLALRLLPDRASPPPTGNPAAYDAYLRGRYHFTRYDREGYERSIDAFRRALAQDPGFALAQAGLAEAHAFLSWAGSPPVETMPLARAAAREALLLDPSLARAHNVLGIVRFYYDWDLDAAETSFRRALELDPGFAEAHHWYAGLLSALERHDEALDHDEEARRLDPISLTVKSDLCWYQLFANRPSEAAAQCLDNLRSEPHHGWSLRGLIEAYLQLGLTDRLREPLLRFWEKNGRSQAEIEALGALDDEELVQLLRDLELESQQRRAQEGREDPVDLAFAHAALGDTDAAFAALERGFEARQAWMVFLDVDPRFAPLRGDSRFADLRRRVGLPPRRPR